MVIFLPWVARSYVRPYDVEEYPVMGHTLPKVRVSSMSLKYLPELVSMPIWEHSQGGLLPA